MIKLFLYVSTQVAELQRNLAVQPVRSNVEVIQSSKDSV